MVYDYPTIQEFIGDSNELLKKLEKAGLWNKDTLVIGLDKSVRPLAYTLRKLSKLEGKELPDMRFFNYSKYDYILSDGTTKKNIAKHLSRKISPKQLLQYEDILILDEYSCSGKTMLNMKEILNRYFKILRDKPRISFASLNADEYLISNILKEELIYANNRSIGRRSYSETGIKDQTAYYKPFLRKKQKIVESKKVDYSYNYAKFIQNRKQLSQDIKNYVRDNELEGENIKSGKLEKAVQLASIISLIGGFIFGYNGITGNVIGSTSSSNFVGVILITLGILGLVFSQMKRRK